MTDHTETPAAVPADLARTRQLFDEALGKNLDGFFAAPNVLEMLDGFLEGRMAFFITRERFSLMPLVDRDEAEELASASADARASENTRPEHTSRTHDSQLGLYL